MEECLLEFCWVEDFWGTFANHSVGVFRGTPAFLGRVFKQAFEAEPENSNSCVHSVVPGLQQELEASWECTGPREVKGSAAFEFAAEN